MAASPLVAFHLHVGTRVALRALAPLAAAATAATVLYGDPTVVLAPLVALLFPPAPSLAAALSAAALGGALATIALPRLAVGLGGWLRHLPASGVTQRRALSLGLVTAQTPLLLLTVAAGGMAWGLSPRITLLRLLGLIPCVWGACLAVLRVRPVARALAVAASVAAFVGSWTALLVALALLVAAEADAGELRSRPAARTVPPRPPRTEADEGTDAVGGAGAHLAAVIAWRALRWRLLAAWFLALPVLLPAVLFLKNNALPPAHRVGAVRLAGLAAVLMVIAGVIGLLAKRRPPWPWVRSLPWSALTRALHDAGLLVIAALPVVAVAITLAPRALPSLLATLPLLALRGAAAIREQGGRPWGGSGTLLVEGALTALLVTLVPWLAAAALGLVPLAARAAARTERRQTAGRWNELQHFATGDPLSWSAE